MKLKETKVAAILAVMFVSVVSAFAADLNVPHTFYPGTTAKSSEINENFTTLYNAVNGAIGIAGPQGPKGDTGATGPAGPQGPKGDTGATGPAGPQGSKGDTGATGSIGPQGPRGDTGATGPQGTSGQQGPQGAKGDTGPQGPAGAISASRCRIVTNRGGSPSYVSIAQCNADEFVTGGGGRAETPGSDLCAGTTRGFIHTNEPTPDMKGWVVDAYAYNWGGDACTEAFAICCH